MSSDPTRLLLDDMVDAIDRILSYVANIPDAAALAANRDSMDILCWNYMRLGEAASQMPIAVVGATPTVAWRKASELRNRIVHGYRTVSADVLWDTADKNLPALRDALVTLRESLPDQ